MKQTISDIVNDAYMDELLDLPPVEADEEAITRRTFSELGLQENTVKHIHRAGHTGTTVAAAAAAGAAAGTGKTLPFVRAQTGGKAKPARRVLRVAAIAVVFILVLSTVVYATSVIYGMIQQKIGYFAPPSTAEPVSGPTFLGSLEMSLTEYNATVDQTVQAAGKTVTLDTVAIDDNFINAFFTLAYDQPIDLDFNPNIDTFMPAYYKLGSLVPRFTLEIDGKAVDAGFSTSESHDPYMADGKTVKMLVRYVLPTMMPDTFTLTLTGTEWATEQGVEPERYNFNLSIDKSASARATRAAEPGQYTFKTAEGDKTLDLEKLALSPFGGVISVRGHWSGNDLNADPAYLMPDAFYITDDTGNALHTYWNNAVGSGVDYYALELLGASPDAKSLTLTPILYDETAVWEPRSYSVADIGQKIETSSLGGYILEDYIVEGGRISLVLKPYGLCNYTGDFIMGDDGITLEGGRSGLLNEHLDRETGLYTYSIDYYAATEAELKAITTFQMYYYDGYALDESAALTLPLAGR